MLQSAVDVTGISFKTLNVSCIYFQGNIEPLLRRDALEAMAALGRQLPVEIVCVTFPTRQPAKLMQAVEFGQQN
jgi:hypothetical protein